MYEYNLYKTVRRYEITLHHNLHHNYSLTERSVASYLPNTYSQEYARIFPGILFPKHIFPGIYDRAQK